MSILNIFRHKHSQTEKDADKVIKPGLEAMEKERKERQLQRHLQLIGRKIPLCRCLMCRKPTDLLTNQEIARAGWLRIALDKPNGSRLVVQLCPECLHETLRFWGVLDITPENFHKGNWE